MPLFIKESFIYKLFEKLLIIPYNNSLLKKNLQKITDCFKNSFLYKRVEKYLDKKPYFLNSVYYKLIRKVVSKIDKLMDFLHKTIKKCLLGSSTFFELRSVKYSTKEKNLLLISTLVSAFNLAYTITNVFLDKTNYYATSGLLLISIILFLFSKNTNCFKNSFIYKIFKSW